MGDIGSGSINVFAIVDPDRWEAAWAAVRSKLVDLELLQRVVVARRGEDSTRSCGPRTTARNLASGKSRTTTSHESLVNCRAPSGHLPAEARVPTDRPRPSPELVTFTAGVRQVRPHLPCPPGARHGPRWGRSPTIRPLTSGNVAGSFSVRPRRGWRAPNGLGSGLQSWDRCDDDRSSGQYFLRFAALSPGGARRTGAMPPSRRPAQSGGVDNAG
jgi:hypothetical protein